MNFKRVFLLFLLILTSVAILSSCKEKNPSDSLDIPLFSVTSGNSELFNSSSPENASPKIQNSFSIENSSKKELSLSFIVESAGRKEYLSATVAAGKKQELSTSFQQNGADTRIIAIYVEYKQDDALTKCSYAFEESGITEMLVGNTLTPDFLIIPVDCTADQLNVYRPLSIILSNSTLKCNSLYLKTSVSGKFIIEDKGTSQFDCEAMYADALNCVVKTPKIPKVENNPSYYLRVKSYNNKVIDHLDITVDKPGLLLDLIDSNSLPTLYEGTKITLSSFTLSDQIVFDIPVSLHFESKFELQTSIKIITDKKAEISISGDSTVTLPNIPVKIDAPNADISWDVPRNKGVTLLDIAKSMKAATLNGKSTQDYNLGGDGEAKLKSVSLDKEKNKNILKSIHWSLDGYVFTATIDTIVDTKTLKNAILDLSVSSGGTVIFDSSVSSGNGKVNLLSSSGCYLTVTDKNGKSLRYLIETEYVPSKIPVVCIETTNGATIESNEEYITGTFYMNCDDITGFKSVSTEEIQIRGRGHSTWKWDKKPYKIKFNSKTSIFGLDAAKDWVLLANYTDKSLIRNYVATEGARILDNLSFVVVQHPVDVFLNGEYLGVYTMGEQLEAKKGRVELQDNETDVDTGYLLEIGGTSSEDVWNETCFYTTLCKYVKVKAPDEKTLTKEQVAYIRDYVKAADEAIMTGVGYEEYVDIDALIDWVIVHELYYNIDCAFRRSCYFTKDAGGKLAMGPIWDFDNAFGNFWKDDKTYSSWATADSTSGYIWDNWMSYLINYPEFRAKFKARWEEVKYPLLEKLIQSIELGSQLIDRSADYNFEKWDILNKRVGCQDSSIVKYNTFDKQIKYLSDFINSRWLWLDQNI